MECKRNNDVKKHHYYVLCLVNRLSIKAYESQTRDVTGVSMAKMQTNIIELLPMLTVCAQFVSFTCQLNVIVATGIGDI